MSRPATTMSRALVGLAAAALVLFAAAPASAGKPCWRAILDDWSDNGRVDAAYADSCYEQALRNLPTDVEIYSDAGDVIEAARDQALRDNSRRPQSRPGTESEPGTGEALQAGNRKGKGGDGDGPIGAALNWGQSAAGDVPLPLLALAGVALLLTAAGGAGLLSRRLRARHVTDGDDPGETPR